MAMEHAAKGDVLNVVICEALDRLSRSQADIAAIFEDLRFHGVAIHTISEGAVDELHVGLKGTMNALYLEETRRKTRRGMEGVVREVGFMATPSAAPSTPPASRSGAFAISSPCPRSSCWNGRGEVHPLGGGR